MSKVEFAYRKLLLVSGRFKDTLEAAAERRDALGICTSLAVGLSVQAEPNYLCQICAIFASCEMPQNGTFWEGRGLFCKHFMYIKVGPCDISFF